MGKARWRAETPRPAAPRRQGRGGRGGAAVARRSSLGGAPPRKEGRGAPVYPGGLC